jgi:hypothetical protein
VPHNNAIDHGHNVGDHIDHTNQHRHKLGYHVGDNIDNSDELAHGVAHHHNHHVGYQHPDNLADPR